MMSNGAAVVIALGVIGAALIISNGISNPEPTRDLFVDEGRFQAISIHPDSGQWVILDTDSGQFRMCFRDTFTDDRINCGVWRYR